jgi:hypothetical protein
LLLLAFSSAELLEKAMERDCPISLAKLHMLETEEDLPRKTAYFPTRFTEIMFAMFFCCTGFPHSILISFTLTWTVLASGCW